MEENMKSYLYVQYVSRVEALIRKEESHTPMWCLNPVSAVLCFLQERRMASDLNTSEDKDVAWSNCTNPGTMLTIIAVQDPGFCISLLCKSNTETIQQWLALYTTFVTNRLDCGLLLHDTLNLLSHSSTEEACANIMRAIDDATALLQAISVSSDALTNALRLTKRVTQIIAHGGHWSWSDVCDSMRIVRETCGDDGFFASLVSTIKQKYPKCPPIIRELPNGKFDEVHLDVEELPCWVMPHNNVVKHNDRPDLYSQFRVPKHLRNYYGYCDD